MVLKVTKVGQGDKTVTLLDIDSHVPVTEKMLEEAMVESFLDAADAGYVGAMWGQFAMARLRRCEYLVRR